MKKKAKIIKNKKLKVKKKNNKINYNDEKIIANKVEALKLVYKIYGYNPNIEINYKDININD